MFGGKEMVVLHFVDGGFAMLGEYLDGRSGTEAPNGIFE
jgi:hypothetical protein